LPTARLCAQNIWICTLTVIGRSASLSAQKRIRRGPRTRRQLRSVNGAAADMVLTPQTRHRPGIGASDRDAHRALPVRAHGALPQDRQI